MIFNFFIGFLLPWLTAIFIYRRARLLIFTVVPFVALLSVILNQLGIQTEIWTLKPRIDPPIFDTIFINLGYNPIMGAWFAYFIHFKQYNRWLIYLCFIILLVGLELIALSMDKVLYHQQWNIFHTFIVYGIGLCLIDLYYSKFNKDLNDS
ncbi:CBO0543 family protein [Halobacillus sp. BBL2006]|uniref:CBO0543 family protein n=1 Tax=Halobacillus sp. BBL2006 TaxID=1543706 RepID=UPI000542F2A7|nr:CBO0543 family protein [Halobacillus sp. BBL2006]KHE69360.1 hypothetical protein LD39_13005 [Halobacillus sp. BBL2006]